MISNCITCCVTDDDPTYPYIAPVEKTQAVDRHVRIFMDASPDGARVGTEAAACRAAAIVSAIACLTTVEYQATLLLARSSGPSLRLDYVCYYAAGFVQERLPCLDARPMAMLLLLPRRIGGEVLHTTWDLPAKKIPRLWMGRDTTTSARMLRHAWSEWPSRIIMR